MWRLTVRRSAARGGVTGERELRRMVRRSYPNATVTTGQDREVVITSADGVGLARCAVWYLECFPAPAVFALERLPDQD